MRTQAPDKTKEFFEIIEAADVSASQTAYVGDDIGDIEIMKLVGLPIAVGDAVDEVKAAAVYITQTAGGAGASREITDLLLKAVS